MFLLFIVSSFYNSYMLCFIGWESWKSHGLVLTKRVEEIGTLQEYKTSRAEQQG